MDHSRRRMIQLGVAAGVGLAGVPTARALADLFLDEHLDSPPVPSFEVPLTIPPVLEPVSRTASTDFYEITQRPVALPIVPGLPPTQLWGYNGLVPGPTIVQERGRNVQVRQRNGLPVPVSVHLHGGDVPADSDGHPLDLIPPGGSKDYFYPGLHAPAPLWYHDHAIHTTSRNVYLGLAGLFSVTDQTERDLGLPQGPFEIPLVIQDKFFRPDGQLAYPQHDAGEPMRQGVFGDVVLVNGRPKPFANVQRRRYRFRALNASNARVYKLRLSVDLPFTVVQSDGGFLPAPIDVRDIMMAPSERYSFILDFRKLPVGTRVDLLNVLDEVPGDPYDPATTREVMRFVVTEDAVDPGSLPAGLPFPEDLPRPGDAVATRTWEFARSGGAWTINGRSWDANRFDAFPKLGTTEIWRFVNKSGGWWHPIHVHLIEFVVLRRTSRPLAPYERGSKDTILLQGNEVVEVAMTWNHFRGAYVMHCHNVEHEDHDMMMQFKVE